MKVRDIIGALEADGWEQVRTTGSHRHYKHSTKPGLVTVAGHPTQDLPPKTVQSIFKQAQLPK